MGLDTPAYQRIAAELAERIDSGALPPGAQLPTRPELEARYGVSRQAVSAAVTLLLHEGYVISRARHGTMVHRPRRVAIPLTEFEANNQPIDAFVSAIREQGLAATQTISVETVIDAKVASQMNAPEDTPLIARKRIRSVDGIPYALADSYFLRAHVEGSAIADPKDIPTGGRHVMAELGIPMDGPSFDRITCRRPSRIEIENLDIAPGVYVIQHTRTSKRADGIPVRHMVSIYPGDRWELQYQVGGSRYEVGGSR